MVSLEGLGGLGTHSAASQELGEGPGRGGGPGRKEASVPVGSLSRCPAPGLGGPGALATRGLKLPQASEHRGGEEGEEEEGHYRALVLPPRQERLTGAGDKRRTCGWPCGPLSGLHPPGCRVSAETLLSARLPACAWPRRQALGRGEGRLAGLTRWGRRVQATWPRGFWTVIRGSVSVLQAAC